MIFPAMIRRRRVDAMGAHQHRRWHLDEVFVKINGVEHCLWRAVDHEGEVLESFVMKRRDRKAALKFLRESLRRHGLVETFVTDRLALYGAAPSKRFRHRADRVRPDLLLIRAASWAGLHGGWPWG